MKVLLGGCSGFIGTVLQEKLLQRGHKVIGISRTARPNNITWTNLQANGLPESIDAVVNLAGKSLMDMKTRWSAQFEAELRASRLDTCSLLSTLIANASKPPAVFASTSAIGYYPTSHTGEYTEDSSGGTGGFMETLCRDWEQSAKLPDNVDCRRVVIRIGIVLGRDGGIIKNMYIPFFFGLGGPVGSGKQWFPWIHVDDVAGIFIHAIENKNVVGVLNAVAPQTATNAEFAKAFAKALWRPAVLPMPGIVIRTLLGPERADVVLQGQKVIPKRTLESGYKYLYPDLQSACKEFAHFAPSRFTIG